ncbi:MAG TPA: response regulator [Terracidiphilus sp.]
MLLISDDPELAEARTLLVESAGFVVEHCAGWQLREYSTLNQFDIFFLCQTIDPQSAGELVIRIRREAPLSRILRVRSKRADHDHLANLYLTAPVEPPDLIHAMEFLAYMAPEARRDTKDAQRTGPHAGSQRRNPAASCRFDRAFHRGQPS